jgi:16S rRNA (uracil1498-N3)-methyltransferase
MFQYSDKKIKNRLYVEGLDKNNDIMSLLTNQQIFYLHKVMKVKEGDLIEFFNETKSMILKFQQNKFSSQETFKSKSNLLNNQKDNKVFLVHSPLKHGKYEFLIEKSSEIGVDGFIPILFNKTIVRDVNIMRIQKIIIESVEQSGQYKLPSFSPLKLLEIFFKQILCLTENNIFLVGQQGSDNISTVLKNIKVDNTNIYIIIGPEGGFSDKEVNIFKEQNCYFFSLGNSILRCETAAITSISFVKNYLI